MSVGFLDFSHEDCRHPHDNPQPAGPGAPIWTRNLTDEGPSTGGTGFTVRLRDYRIELAPVLAQ